jgi:hypothetical protein
MYVRRTAQLDNLWVFSDVSRDSAAGRATPYLEAPFNVNQCQFSPDSHWVAYVSDESKRGFEVYVQSFPAGHGKVQVSANGGAQPRWNSNGKELFYSTPQGTLMAVDIETSPVLRARSERRLFDSQLLGPNNLSAFGYDVAPDGGSSSLPPRAWRAAKRSRLW